MDEIRIPANYSIGEDETIAQTPRRRAREVPARVVMRIPRDGAWIPVTAREFSEQVDRVASGLIASGIEPGDRVALMCNTRYEWSLLDFAIWHAGAVSVPIYPSSSQAQVEWILADSEARLLIVENAEHREIADAIHTATVERAGEIEHPVLVVDDGAIDILERRGEGGDVHEIIRRVGALRASDMATLIYTSGTTGRPKGCVLPHHNLLAEVRGILNHTIGAEATAGRRLLMFLPMAHVLARAVTLAGFEGGATIGHWSDFATVSQAFATFKPNLILGVPRVFEKVRDGAEKKAKAGGPISSAVFMRAEATAVAYSEALDRGTGPGPVLKARRALYDKLLYAKLRAAMGDECLYAISGGGALLPKLGHFFRGLGVPVFEGYGLTESTAAQTVNGPGCHKMGTVGRPMGGSSVKVAEDGELLLRGQTVFSGYWKNDEATEDAFTDGWFHTGDLGAIDRDGYVRITGRKKDILVTAGGKNVSPGPLEDLLRSNALISQAVVVGDGRPYISALITVDEDVLAAWASDNGKEGSTAAELYRDQDLRSAIHVLIDEANESVSHAEGIKRFAILKHDLTEADGYLTATQKIKRNVVTEHYGKLIDRMYGA